MSFSGLGSTTEWSFERDGKSLRVAVAARLATNQIDAAVDACARGLGVGQFLHYQVQALLASRKLLRVLASFEPGAVPINVLYPQTRLLSANVRAFVDWTAPRLRERLQAIAPMPTRARKSARR